MLPNMCLTMFGPKLIQKLASLCVAKKCGDNGASVATFVATLVFTLDTAGLQATDNDLVFPFLSHISSSQQHKFGHDSKIKKKKGRKN